MLALVLPLLLSPAAEAARPGPWSSWGQEALARAQRDDRPLLVVLGDSFCAPCRRAEADLTADADTVSFLAENLVGIRVDRFERPDVDDVLVTAAGVLGGSRNYPLAVLLTPDGRPFAVLAAAGSGDRPDAAGLKAFASRGALDYRKDRQRVESLARATLDSLRQAQRSATPSRPLDAATLKRARTGSVESFGSAVTAASDGAYPHASLRLLLEEQERTGDASLLRMAELALDFFAGLGEPRSLWDTALLLRASVAAHAATGKPLYRERAAALARSARALADPAGGFRAARGDAPSETDERVFAGWNGLMIGALAAAGRELDLKQDADTAREAALRVLARVGPLEELKRYARGTDSGGPALLEDYALLAEGSRESRGDRHRALLGSGAGRLLRHRRRP
jgi:hypothetical protein